MLMKKKGKNLVKIIGLSAFLKLSLLIPSSTRIKDTNYNNDLQQNLNNSLNYAKYGEEVDFPVRNGSTYYSKSF
jgi:hypothetical protein